MTEPAITTQTTGAWISGGPGEVVTKTASSGVIPPPPSDAPAVTPDAPEPDRFGGLTSVLAAIRVDLDHYDAQRLFEKIKKRTATGDVVAVDTQAGTTTIHWDDDQPAPIVGRVAVTFLLPEAPS